jgi:hypothetical protein
MPTTGLLHDLSPSTGGGQRLDDREGGTEVQLVTGVGGSMRPSMRLRSGFPACGNLLAPHL